MNICYSKHFVTTNWSQRGRSMCPIVQFCFIFWHCNLHNQRLYYSLCMHNIGTGNNLPYLYYISHILISTHSEMLLLFRPSSSPIKLFSVLSLLKSCTIAGQHFKLILIIDKLLLHDTTYMAFDCNGIIDFTSILLLLHCSKQQWVGRNKFLSKLFVVCTLKHKNT